MGNFSGRMTLNGAGMPNCVVKVLNVYHPNWGSIASQVLNSIDGTHTDNVNIWQTTTDANGNWAVNGISAGYYMLKIFPWATDPTCVGFGEIPNSSYITAESGYINSGGDNFMSTRASPSSQTYNVYNSGRFLFDLPVHMNPTVGGALNGASNYTDLNVNFYTRNNFSTSQGWKSNCTVGTDGGGSPPVAGFSYSPGAPVAAQSITFTNTSTNSPTSYSWTFGDGTTSTATNPTKTYTAAGTYTVSLTASNSFGNNTFNTSVVVASSGGGGGEPPPPPSNTLQANFNWSPASPQVGQAVQFTSTSTGTPVTWSWYVS